MSAQQEEIPFDRRYLFHRHWWGRWRWFILVLVHYLVLGCIFRFSAKNRRRVPRSGSVFLLGNHNAALDPYAIGVPTLRRSHQMASSSLLRVPYLGALVRIMGSFAKEQFVRDAGAMQVLDTIHGDGEMIIMFPEGTRSFDGRQLPMRKSIGTLIKRLGGQVVCARTTTAHLAQPRWARYPRLIPFKVEYLGPFTFSEDQSDEEVRDFIADQLRIDPDAIQLPRLSFGWRLAHGLPAYLWACPACMSEDALELSPDSHNAVRCVSCKASWTVDLRQQLHPRSEHSQALSVVRARIAMEAHFGYPMVQDALLMRSEGIAFRSRGMVELRRLDKTAKPKPTFVTEQQGSLVITEEQVRLVSEEEEVLWSCHLADIRSVSVEVQSRLYLRIGKELYHVHPQTESQLKFYDFLRGWQDRAWHKRREQKAPQ